MLEVCLPGTGGMMPLPERFLACCWAEYQGRALLIDCGEGTQVALRRASCVTSRLKLLLLTHYHADHVSGLPGLLLTLGNQDRTEKLMIAGPTGLERVVSALRVIAPDLPFPIELHTLAGGDALDTGIPGLTVEAMALRHRVPCLGYRATLRRKPVFNPDKARALDIPVRLYSALHAGETVALPDGRTVRPEEVLDGQRAPVSLCYVTDTRPLPAISDFARDADLLVCEGMYADAALDEKMQQKKHMLYRDAARLARDAGVKRLWLTHFSPAVYDPAEGAAEALSDYPHARVASDGIRADLP